MAIDRSISYDSVTKDYRGELDGLLIGFFRTYRGAEAELDRVAFDWLTHGYTATAQQLDGDPPVDDLLPEQPGDQYPGIEYEEERARYTRADVYDKRPYGRCPTAADAWLDAQTGLLRWVEVGDDPNLIPA